MRHPFCVLAFVTTCGLSSVANAEPLERGALRLEWRAPGGCPNGAEMIERIEALLGARIVDLAPEPIVANGTVRKLDASHFELALETHQRQQRFVRSMKAPSCAELSDAGALVLALAIDPKLAERRAQAAAGSMPESAVSSSGVVSGATAAEAPKPATPKPAGAEPRSSVPTPETPEPNASRALLALRRSFPEISAGVAVVADAGTVSNQSLGARASLDLGYGLVHARFGVLWLPPARSYVSSDGTQGGTVDLVAAEGAACAASRGNVSFEGCLGLELGRLHGRGFGTVLDNERSVLWLAPGAGGVLRVRAGEALSVVATAGFLLGLQSIEFTLENIGSVHTVAPVIGRLGLGIEAEFP